MTPADRQVLEAFLEQLIVLPRRPLRSLTTLLAGLFASYPLLASVNGLSGELQDTFEWLLGEQWDVVQIEHSYSFQPYEDALARNAQPFVLTEHNVESALGAATYDRLPRWALPFIRYEPCAMIRSIVKISPTGASKKVKLRACCAAMPALLSRVRPSSAYRSQPTLRRRSMNGDFHSRG